MAANKIRLIDSDVISNILKTASRSDIDVNIINTNVNLKLITTSLVMQEVNAYIRKFKDEEKNNETVLYHKKIWRSIHGTFEIKQIKTDPSTLKNLGERSLIETIPKLNTDKYAIVSNNKKDIMQLFKKNNITANHYKTPFEFYEEMEKYWFKNNYKELIKFMILSNRDFKIIKKMNLGNILYKVQ